MTVESALLLLFELNNGKKESGFFFNYSEVTLIEFYDWNENHNYVCNIPDNKSMNMYL